MIQVSRRGGQASRPVDINYQLISSRNAFNRLWPIQTDPHITITRTSQGKIRTVDEWPLWQIVRHVIFFLLPLSHNISSSTPPSTTHFSWEILFTKITKFWSSPHVLLPVHVRCEYCSSFFPPLFFFSRWTYRENIPESYRRRAERWGGRNVLPWTMIHPKPILMMLRIWPWIIDSHSHGIHETCEYYNDAEGNQLKFRETAMDFLNFFILWLSLNHRPSIISRISKEKAIEEIPQEKRDKQ